jgi:hypothetical protein
MFLDTKPPRKHVLDGSCQRIALDIRRATQIRRRPDDAREPNRGSKFPDARTSAAMTLQTCINSTKDAELIGLHEHNEFLPTTPVSATDRARSGAGAALPGRLRHNTLSKHRHGMRR